MKNATRFGMIVVALVVVSCFCLSAVYAAPPAKPIVLKVGSTWEESLLWNDGLKIFSKMVAENSKGELAIKFAGGPETFPSFESIEMLRRGVIDLLNTATTFYTKALPPVFTMIVSEKSAEEERASGYFDAMNKLHQKNLNAVYLARMDDLKYVFAFKKPVNKADLSGLKLRGLPFSMNLIKALGGSPIVVAPPELYSSLEKGVVDGYSWPQVGHVERKFPEIVKYHTEHLYYRVSCVLLMNKNSFDKLPPHLQKVIMDVMPAVEKASIARQAENVKTERAELVKEGVQFITWPPAEVKKFYEVARKTGTEEALRVSPDQAPTLLKMIIK